MSCGFAASQVRVVAVSFFAVLTAIFIIRLGYPFTYLSVLAISPLMWMAFRCGQRIAVATLAIFTGTVIGYHSGMYIFPDVQLFNHLISPVDKLDVFSHVPRNFAVLDNVWHGGFLINFPYLRYAMPIVAIVTLYVALQLLAEHFKGRTAAAFTLSVLPFTFVGFYGLPISVAFGVLAIYLILRGRLGYSLIALSTSAMFGTRGLIAFGVLYLLLFFKRASRIQKIVLFIAVTAIAASLTTYVSYYLGIISAFFSHRGNFEISAVLKDVIAFYFRERLQPWQDFAIISAVLLVVILAGLVLSLHKRFYVMSVSIAVLTGLFVVTFVGRISIFENPASDIPYYFLYGAAINSILVFAMSNIKRIFVAALFVLLFIGFVPKFGYVAFYEHTFGKFQEYYALLKYITNNAADSKFVYDYGSFTYAKYVPNGTLLQPWQNPERFRGHFYIYSRSIHSMRMFFTLPHVQSRLRQICVQNVLYDSGQYRYSEIR